MAPCLYAGHDFKPPVCLSPPTVWCIPCPVQAAVSGSEPSDAIRAVNALLTQLDGLKRYPNVMVLTTSNITEAIDAAFVDRADIKVGDGCMRCQCPCLAARPGLAGPPMHSARPVAGGCCLQEVHVTCRYLFLWYVLLLGSMAKHSGATLQMVCFQPRHQHRLP
jgi:hypothetical protein